MRALIPFLVFALAGEPRASAQGRRTETAGEAPPNVLFILSDDQGWGDYGFMGHPHVRTPHLDTLAQEGLLYDRGYVTAPLCRPSLASLVTGLYPHQTRIRGNDPLLPEGVTAQGLRAKDPELHLQYRARMTAPMAGLPSLVRLLRDQGYATLQTGKWWEGDPKEHGFTDAMTHGDPSRGGRHGDRGLEIGRRTLEPIRTFIDRSIEDRQPFFVWYGVFLPHSPHNAPERLFREYEDLAPNEPTARYWANIAWFDETCGELIELLDERGLRENTLIVFTCDNGWTQDPERRNRDDGRSKREPTEAGIRTPMFLHWPGTLEPRREREVLASNIDVATTILGACGIEPPASMEGLDLRDTASLEKRGRVFVEAYSHDSDLDRLDEVDHGLKARVMIEGWDKLVVRPDGVELFDLRTDTDDREDLSARHPEKVERLREQLAAWLEATGSTDR